MQSKNCKIRILVFLACLFRVSILLAELNVEKEKKKSPEQEIQALFDTLDGKKSNSTLTKEESEQIDNLLGKIRWNWEVVLCPWVNKGRSDLHKINEEDENLLTKGAKYGDQNALIGLMYLYEYQNDSEKYEKVERSIINKLVSDGDYKRAFCIAIGLFIKEKKPEKLRKYGWMTAINLYEQKKLDGTFDGVEEILPFLIDNQDPVVVYRHGFIDVDRETIKRPSFYVEDSLLASAVIDEWRKINPESVNYWVGRKSEATLHKDMPAAFKSYKQGALLGERRCIHKVIELIEKGKGVVPSISEELIWRYVAQALETDPDGEWAISNKQKISLLESSFISSSVSLEPFRISANKLVDQINITSSQTKKSKPSKETTLSLGSGFIISADGIILTACHVIKDRKKIFVSQSDGNLPVQIVAKDEQNDIAILKCDGLTSKTYLSFSKAEPKQGDKISTFGFPHSNIEGRDCKYSSGEISSLIGLGSDKRYLRLNLQVSPGNSGGPLLDASNRIIGLLTAKLDSVKMLEETGDLPTGVAYAVKDEWILRLLKTNGLFQKISFTEAGSKPSESIVLISAE